MATGKYAKFISDRSGLEFPYNEMAIEWNGAKVHISEYEKKHPQNIGRYRWDGGLFRIQTFNNVNVKNAKSPIAAAAKQG